MYKAVKVVSLTLIRLVLQTSVPSVNRWPCLHQEETDRREISDPVKNINTSHSTPCSIDSCPTRKLCYRKDDARYISRSWAVAEIWPFEIIQDGGGRHLEFVRIENSAIISAVPEKKTPPYNQTWSGSDDQLRRYSHLKFFQDGGGRHFGFVRTGNSAIRSTVPENITLEQNMKWIGGGLRRYRQLKFFQHGGGHHLGFVWTVISAVRSAVPKNLL